MSFGMGGRIMTRVGSLMTIPSYVCYFIQGGRICHSFIWDIRFTLPHTNGQQWTTPPVFHPEICDNYIRYVGSNHLYSDNEFKMDLGYHELGV
jgi:hypothetical protein